MSYKLSEQSTTRLMTCDERLRSIVTEVSKRLNISVLEGHRGQAAQDLAIAQGRSQTPWPTSKHNKQPSLAVDVVPYPVDWKNESAFNILAMEMAFEAGKQGVRLRWGGTFKSFRDLPHFELELA